MLKELDEIQNLLNQTMEDTKDNWKEMQKYSDQLEKIEDTTNNIEMGGIKISELNKSMGVLSQFLGGAFKEVNKSVQNISNEIEVAKKEIDKKE